MNQNDREEKRGRYLEFLRKKAAIAPSDGLEVESDDVNPLLKPHQRDIVLWALRGGRRAIFAAFGLGKSFIQIEILRILQVHVGGRALVTLLLDVWNDFSYDLRLLSTGDDPIFTDQQRSELKAWLAADPRRRYEMRFIRSIMDAGETGLYATNYETVRDGKLNPAEFVAVSLDEASCLRGMGSTKTFREFMRLFDGMRYKFVATATPSPNDYIELLAYSAFLEIMDVGEAKTRFFRRNSEKADSLTIHEHKRREFWLWCASWAIFLQRPSDLGYSDEGYDLPAMDVHWHEVPSDHSRAGFETSGQGRLVRSSAIGVVEASREKRDSLQPRLAKLMELRAIDPGAHRILWHDLEDERRAIERAVPSAASVYGTQAPEERARLLMDFSAGRVQELATKPRIAGSGCNFQRHCSWAIFMGIGFKFNDFIQAIHRVYRFLQTNTVRIDLIYTEAEARVKEELQRKWTQHAEMMAEMSAIIREFGLAQASLALSLQRATSVERSEMSGAGWRIVNNDSVLETIDAPADSVHLILTSIPFSTQYEYSPSYLDFGHTDSNEHFWEQMEFLIPELLRILKPGRLAAIHVKDRIVPGGINKLGFQTVYPFHCDAINHFMRHGFAYMGMKTIVTDVVRENNQTYRLGWSEQCKDGSKMGVGMPEYLLIFRKPPSDTANSYADDPVIKNKGQYSRSRWQVDAHGFTRSSGNRLISPDEFDKLTHQQIFQRFKRHSLETVYDFEEHVALAESLECCPDCGHIHTGKRTCAHGRGSDHECPCNKPGGRLPVTFMLLQPQSWSDEVWADVTRMLSLNSAQSAKGRETHLCPMQFDIADRAITQWTNPGEIVFDPFAGLGTVPYRAILLGREGAGVELASRYCADAVPYLMAAEQKINTPTLFDFMEEPSTEPEPALCYTPGNGKDHPTAD